MSTPFPALGANKRIPALGLTGNSSNLPGAGAARYQVGQIADLQNDIDRSDTYRPRPIG